MKERNTPSSSPFRDLNKSSFSPKNNNIIVQNMNSFSSSSSNASNKLIETKNRLIRKIA